jgi:hypothetical protein
VMCESLPSGKCTELVLSDSRDDRYDSVRLRFLQQ